MTGIIAFLNRHKTFTLVTGSLYFLATVVFHKQIANLSLDIERKLSFKTYNLLLGWVILSVFLICAFLILRKIIKSDDSFFTVVFLIITILLLVGAHFAVLAVNVEYIHLVHYILLAFFVFGLTLRFGATVFWVTLLGTVDEVYQYYVVWPAQAYMDFNDIIYDMLGGVIAVIFIYVTVNKKFFVSVSGPSASRKKRSLSPVFFVSSVLVFSYILLSAVGLIQFAPGPDDGDGKNAPILLNRTAPSPKFWTVFEKGKVYHIFKPFEFALVVGAVTLLYSGIDSRIKKAVK